MQRPRGKVEPRPPHILSEEEREKCKILTRDELIELFKSTVQHNSTHRRKSSEHLKSLFTAVRREHVELRCLNYQFSR